MPALYLHRNTTTVYDPVEVNLIFLRDLVFSHISEKAQNYPTILS